MVLTVIAYIVSFLFNYIHNAGSGFTALRWIYKNNPNKTNLFSLIVSLSPVGYLFTQDINSNVSTWLLANTLFALFYNKISNKYKSVYICLASMILMFFIPEIVIKICQQYNLDQAKWLLYFEYKMRGIYSFSLGIMIYFIKPALDKLKNKYSLTSIANFGSLFATVALLYGFYKYTDWNTVYIMLFVTMIIVCQMLHENIAFVNKIWSRLGKYSYAFFMCTFRLFTIYVTYLITHLLL